MGRWQVPEKILLPAEPDGPTAFAYNGRLPNGDQVMGYVRFRSGDTYPSTKPFTQFTVILFRFDADGTLRSVEFGSTQNLFGNSRGLGIGLDTPGLPGTVPAARPEGLPCGSATRPT